jgi:hypothetical protein
MFSSLSKLIEIDDHVGFIAADFTGSCFFLFFDVLPGCRLHINPLAAYGHLCLVAAFVAHAYFHFVSHFSLL